MKKSEANGQAREHLFFTRKEVVGTRERTIVTMADGDPGLPGGHKIEDIPKARERRGKWQRDKRPDQEPTDPLPKESAVTLFESIAVFGVAGVAFRLLLPYIPVLTVPLLGFSLGGAVARAMRAGTLAESPFNFIFGVGAVVVGGLAVLKILATFSAFAFGAFVISALAGAVWGYTDYTMFGLRTYYYKE